MRRFGDADTEFGDRALDRGRQQIDDAPAGLGVVTVAGEQNQEGMHAAVVISPIEDAYISRPMRQLDDADDHAVHLVDARTEEFVDGQPFERGCRGALVVGAFGPREAGADPAHLVVHEWQVEHARCAHLAREQPDEAQFASGDVYGYDIEAGVAVKGRPDQRRAGADLARRRVVARGRSRRVSERGRAQQAVSLIRIRVDCERTEQYEILREPCAQLGRLEFADEALHRGAVVVDQREQRQRLPNAGRGLIAQGLVFDTVDLDIHQRGERCVSGCVGPLDVGHSTFDVAGHREEGLEEAVHGLIAEYE